MQNSLTVPLMQVPTDLLTHTPDSLRLRGRAAEGAESTGSHGELKKAAQEFESLFVAYLLKVMRETIEESGSSEGGLGKGIYTDLFDQEVSREIARHGALGISDLLMKRLSVQVPEIRHEEGSQLRGHPEGRAAEPLGSPGE